MQRRGLPAPFAVAFQSRAFVNVPQAKTTLAVIGIPALRARGPTVTSVDKDAVGSQANRMLVDELRSTALACGGSGSGPGVEGGHREPPRRVGGSRDIQPRCIRKMDQDISKLYVSALSPFGMRLRLVMAFTGQALPEVPPPGGSGSDAMKAISYFGKIPALDSGGRVLIESIPLMEYLVEKARDSRLIPGTPEDRAAMRGICLAHDNYVLAAIRPMFTQLRSGKPDAATVVAAQTAAADQYEVLTRLFDTVGDFVLGGRPTLADLAIAPFACLFGRTYPMFGQVSPFVQQPRLASWSQAVHALPQVATLIEKMEAALTKAFTAK